MAKKFTSEHTVLYYEGDVTNHVTIAMLLNMLILNSEEQNINLGIDHHTLAEQGVGWVVTSYDIQINKLPKVDQAIKITTSGTYRNKMFAYREFWVRDSQDNLLVKVNSIWVLINEETRKVTRLPEEIVAPYESEVVKKMPKLPRPNKILTEQANSKKYQVRYSDIDFNGHVNNSKYLDWMIDGLSMEFLLKNQPSKIAIRFENEVKYGQLVTSEVEINDNVTNHEILSNGNLSASATIEWKNN